MDNNIAMIDTAGLNKAFGNFKAVSNVNLKVLDGKIHGFIGPNGAGKTTTMKMLIGAIKPTSGKGTIKGFELGSMQARKIIGFAPEFPSFYSDITAFDYLVYMAGLSGVDYRQACKRAGKLLGMLELDKFGDKKVVKFSTGMKKKIIIAQAMIHEPELLILDEPTANLDPTARMGIIDNLKQLASEKKITIFISSHVLTELELFVEYVTLINKGEIVLQGEMREIKQLFNKGQFTLKTSDNSLAKEALSKYPSVLSIIENEKGELKLITEDTKQLKKDVMYALSSEDLTMESFIEDEATLDGIYRNMVEKGGEK